MHRLLSGSLAGPRVPPTLPLRARYASSPRLPLHRLRSSRGDSDPPSPPPSDPEPGTTPGPDPRSGEFTPEGNHYLQDDLVDMLRLEVKKEHINEAARSEAEQLMEAADKAKLEIDIYGMEMQARTDIAFENAMARINEMADEAEADLKKNRELIEAEEEGIDEFEKRIVDNGNAGTFFKGLYQPAPKRPGSPSASRASLAAGSGAGDAVSDEEVVSQARLVLRRIEEEERAARDREREAQLKDEFRHPVRKAYYGFLLTVLLSVVAYEIAGKPDGEVPSYFSVFLYGGIAVILGLQFLREGRMSQ